jgi:hypothetical protein
MIFPGWPGEIEARSVPRPETTALAIVVTWDPIFIRSCEDGEQHAEVRVGNVETKSGGRQAFDAVAKADTDFKISTESHFRDTRKRVRVLPQAALGGYAITPQPILSKRPADMLI